MKNAIAVRYWKGSLIKDIHKKYDLLMDLLVYNKKNISIIDNKLKKKYI